MKNTAPAKFSAMQSIICSVALLAAMLLPNSGCQNADPAAGVTAEKNKTNIQKVANAYILFATLKRNSAPESEEDLVEFVTGNKSILRNLNLMGIDPETFADCFVSTVDDEPFSIRWGLQIESEGSAVPLVFEKTGAGGVRRVALSDSRILEIEDDRKYQNLWAGIISKEEAGPAAWEQGPDVPDVDEAKYE